MRMRSIKILMRIQTSWVRVTIMMEILEIASSTSTHHFIVTIQKPSKTKKIPRCNKDDAAGARHTGKAENPEEDPANDFGHFSYCLSHCRTVCLYNCVTV